MLNKAMQAHSESHEVDSQPDDEFSLFAGQTRLMSLDQPFTSPAPTPKPRQSQAKPAHCGPLEAYPRYSDHQLLPHEPLPNKQAFLPDNYLDDLATFSDLSEGWDGLFHEVPQPSYAFASSSHSHPHEPLPNKQAFLPDNYLDDFQATFSDLSEGWDGLFHEVPQPSYAFASSSHSVKAWNVERDNAKFDHHKPWWIKPKMLAMEKATCKPALANFTTENTSSDEEEEEEEDVQMSVDGDGDNNQ
jgi:hypothetical protein